MIKKNNLRRIYMIYVIAIGELFVAALAISADYVIGGTLLNAVYILAAAAAVLIPAIMYLLYRLRGKDNAASSDELEQMVLTKAFALSGLTAITLLPVLLALVCVFGGAAGYVVLGYTAVVAGTMKLGTYYYYKKF
jgi:uncharacterized membrane protein